MKRVRNIVIAIIIAAIAVGLFIYAYNEENEPLPEDAPVDSIVINEFMASNQNVIADGTGSFNDWIEVYNPTDREIDLTGLGLSDNEAQIKWFFPNVMLQPGGYMLLFGSDTAVSDAEAEYQYLGFKLNASGDAIYLTDSLGNLLDAVEFGEQQDNVSLGRDATDTALWRAYTEPTPGFSNDEAGAAAFAQTRIVEHVDVLITEVMPSNNTTLKDNNGNFSDYIELCNVGDEPADLSRYALTDNPDNIMKWRFPEIVLQPGEYLVVFASGDGEEATDIGAKALHTDFRISAYKETIVLADPMGLPLDEVALSEMPVDTAYARVQGADGAYTDEWAQADMPSPGQANNPAGVATFETTNVVASGDLIINEVMIANNEFLPEEDGEFYDWIELHNSGASPVNLADYALSDDTANPAKWRFPSATVQPGGYLTVLASGLADVPEEDDDVKKKYIHTNFRLSAAGETLALYDSEDKLLDRYRIRSLPRGVSVGRRDNTDALVYYAMPTPGEVNASAMAGIADVPEVSVAAGSYDAAVQIELASETPDVQIYYTTDGNEPTQSDTMYTQPLTMNETGMIRARAYREGYIQSEIGTYTYFVGETHSLPLLSIVTAPDNLWDEETGIYAMGPNAEDEYPFIGANFHENWEKPASFEVFDETGARTFAQNAALRIQGGYSRGKEQKAFALFARTEYGPGAFEYAFFEDRPYTEYQSIQLRQGGQDQNIAKIKEAVLLALVKDQGFRFLTQAVRPYVLYLNGKYWGVYYMQEKRNEDFIAAYEGIDDPDSLNILKATSIVLQGSNEDYKELLNYIRDNDMSQQTHYDYIAQYIDTDSFMDVMVNQVWIANSDYANMQFYQVPDGKWKQIYYDFCWTFNKSAYPEANHPTLTFRMEDRTTASTLFTGLLSYKPWRDAYIERFAWALKEVYNPERVIAEIDRQAALIADEIPAERAEFGGSVENWEANVQSMRAFAQKRGAFIVGQLDDTFSLSSEQKQMLNDAIDYGE